MSVLDPFQDIELGEERTDTVTAQAPRLPKQLPSIFTVADGAHDLINRAVTPTSKSSDHLKRGVLIAGEVDVLAARALVAASSLKMEGFGHDQSLDVEETILH